MVENRVIELYSYYVLTNQGYIIYRDWWNKRNSLTSIHKGICKKAIITLQFLKIIDCYHRIRLFCYLYPAKIGLSRILTSWFAEVVFKVSMTKNPSIYNLIRWFAGPMGQTTHWPSVWCYKYYFIFHKILRNSFFNLCIFLFFS